MLTKSKLQYLKNLSQKKYREKGRVFLVEGWRGVEEACAALKEIEILVHTKAVNENHQYGPFLSTARGKSKERLEISEKEFSLIADTVAAQGIAAVVKKPIFNADDEIEKLLKQDNAFVVALDHIADPGNLGAIIRTSDWFGLDVILLGRNCVELYNPKVVRSTVGSIFHLPILDCSENSDRFPDLLKRLQKNGFTLFGGEVSGNADLRTHVWPKKSLLVIGNEARGISSEITKMLDEHLVIPKFGDAESLNAGVAAGVFLAHHSFQQKGETT
ncbi:MAG: RNA methyltransferase [Bacteroidota bacterium]